MRNPLLSVALATSLLSGPIAVSAAKAQPVVTPAQYVFHGREYCWYDNGWRGPGFYWCGYATRRGLGWGGGPGWHGWRPGVHADNDRRMHAHHRAMHRDADERRDRDDRRPG